MAAGPQDRAWPTLVALATDCAVVWALTTMTMLLLLRRRRAIDSVPVGPDFGSDSGCGSGSDWPRHGHLRPQFDGRVGATACDCAGRPHRAAAAPHEEVRVDHHNHHGQSHHHHHHVLCCGCGYDGDCDSGSDSDGGFDSDSGYAGHAPRPVPPLPQLLLTRRVSVSPQQQQLLL